MRPTALIPVLVLALAGAAQADTAERTVERTIDVDGAVRSYFVHVPTGLDRTKPAPVVFVFHGAGSDAESMVKATGLDAMADRERFVVVYPRARGLVTRYDVDGTAEVRMVRAILVRLRGRLAVDARRVFATGFSNGAALCYRLAAEMPSELAAIAPVAGYLPGSVRAGPSTPVPLLHAHGGRDGRVSLPATDVATWASWCGCRGAPVESAAPEMAPLSARRFSYPCASGVDVTLLRIDGVGHVWAGGPGGPLTRAIWAFFRLHPKAGNP